MTTAPTDTATWMRGKLRLAGISEDVTVGEYCDAVFVLMLEGAPVDEMKKWRRRFDREMWKIRPPDRSQWGRLPTQRAEAARLTGGS